MWLHLPPLLVDAIPYFPWLMLATAVPTFIALRYLQAPYAKFSTPNLHPWWGPPIPPKWAWIIQESPSLLCSLLSFALLSHRAQRHSSGNLLLLSLYLLHYLIRVCVFPLLMRGGKPTPLFVLALSFLFCVVNGLQQGYALGRTLPPTPLTSFTPLQWLGVGLFALGFLANQHSDHTLRSLRQHPGDTSHHIPYGGLFRYVTAANYCGEWVEWVGWALACQTWAAWAFAVYTFANLGPRAVSYHQWYQSKFESYPKDRKAMIPFIY